MSKCQSSQDSEHRWEWLREHEGVIEYVCMNANCSEIMVQYIDTGSGC